METHIKKTCVVCGGTMDGHRADAEVCSDSCRVKKHRLVSQQRQSISIPTQSNVAVLEAKPVVLSKREVREIELRTQIAHKTEQFYKGSNFLESVIIPQLHENTIKRKNEASELEKLEKWLNLSEKELFEKIYQRKIKEYSIINGDKFQLYSEQQQAFEKCKMDTITKAKILRESIENREIEIKNLKYTLESQQNQLRIIQKEVKSLKNHLTNLLKSVRRESYQEAFLATPLQEKSTKSEKIINKNTLNGKELLTKRLPPKINIKGLLGDFLGEIDRNKFFCAITGDAGAGKSTFSFYIAQVFVFLGFNVKYYSLEMGINSNVKKLCAKLNLGKENFFVTDTASLDTIQDDAANFDVLIVDSFGKLKANSDNIDELRNNFPNTLFFCIFQKTTKGEMRGGSGVLFACSMNINIALENEKRVLQMKKSRYGTQGKTIYFNPKLQ